MVRTLTLALLVTATALLAAEPKEADVRARVAQIRKSDTDAWRQIPWTATLLDAVKAAEKEKRPLFVFSHEGNIDTGRC